MIFQFNKQALISVCAGTRLRWCGRAIFNGNLLAVVEAGLAGPGGSQVTVPLGMVGQPHPGSQRLVPRAACFHVPPLRSCGLEREPSIYIFCLLSVESTELGNIQVVV